MRDAERYFDVYVFMITDRRVAVARRSQLASTRLPLASVARFPLCVFVYESFVWRYGKNRIKCVFYLLNASRGSTLVYSGSSVCGLRFRHSFFFGADSRTPNAETNRTLTD